MNQPANETANRTNTGGSAGQGAASGANSNVVTIDLAEVFRIIWKHMDAIIIFALIIGIITFAGTMFLISPKYESGFTAFVNNRNSQDTTQSVQSGDVNAAQSLTYTYASIMTSRPVIEDALTSAGLSAGSGEADVENGLYTYETVKDDISTNIETNTQLVELTVTLEDPENAYRLATAISEIAPDYISDIVDGTSMKVVSKPILPTRQSSPNPLRNTIVGILVGALVMIVIVVVRGLADTRVKSSQELEDRFGIPVIGTIPNYENAASGRGHYGKYGYRYYKSRSSGRSSSSSAGDSKDKKE